MRLTTRLYGTSFVFPQISYASTAAILSDREQFQSFFRLYPSEQNYLPALVEVIKVFNWSRIGIITEMATVFTGVRTAIHAVYSTCNYVQYMYIVLGYGIVL